jgi:hypothetical protein
MSAQVKPPGLVPGLLHRSYHFPALSRQNVHMKSTLPIYPDCYVLSCLDTTAWDENRRSQSNMTAPTWSDYRPSCTVQKTGFDMDMPVLRNSLLECPILANIGLGLS